MTFWKQTRHVREALRVLSQAMTSIDEPYLDLAGLRCFINMKGLFISVLAADDQRTVVLQRRDDLVKKGRTSKYRSM